MPVSDPDRPNDQRPNDPRPEGQRPEDPRPNDHGPEESKTSHGHKSGKSGETDTPEWEGHSGSKERYRQLFETSQEGVVLTTPSGEVIDCNSAFCRLTGYDRDELLGSRATSLYDRETHQQLVRALQENQRVRDLEARLWHKSGKELLCQISAVLWTAEKGEAKAVQSCVRDVTEERRARQALQESEEKFRTLTEKALVGIALLREEEYVYVNPELGRITGYAPEELVGQPPEIIIHPEDQPLARRRIQERIEGRRETDRYEARVLTKAGETRHVIIAGGRIEYQGAPAIIGIIQDITGRKRMQREILKVQEAERRRIGKDLHDGVASELTGVRLMLSNIAGKAEAGEASGPEIARRLHRLQKMVGRSMEEVRRLSRGLNPAGLREEGLPQALAHLAKNMEAARFEVESVEDSEEETLEEGNLEEGGLEEDLKLEGDVATHLYWIAQEAVTNALKYAGAQEIVIRLSLRESSLEESSKEGLQEEELVLDVKDDGKGFAPSAIEKEESLGLRSMQYRADLLGADLKVDSTPGEGTLVRCRLPL